MTDILICGVGGQGIVLTSKLIASMAMEKGMTVKSAETIGMAQKGGSVTSFLRIGAKFSPMFAEGSADIIIAFEPSEAVRELRYLKKGGSVVVNTHPIMPVTSALTGGTYKAEDMLSYLSGTDCKLISLDAEEYAAKCGSPRTLNMIMLAAALQSEVLPFTREDAVMVMTKTVKPQFVEMNTKALNMTF